MSGRGSDPGPNKPHKDALLVSRVERLAQAEFAGRDGREVAAEIGLFAAATPAAATVKLSRMRSHPAYQAELARLRKDAHADGVASLIERKQILSQIARGTLKRKQLDDAGAEEEMDPDFKERIAAIRELNAMESIGNSGETKERLVIVMPAAIKDVEAWVESVDMPLLDSK